MVKIDTPEEEEKTVRPPMVIDAIGTRDESNRVRDQLTQTGYESSEIEDNGYEVTDPVHKQSSHQPYGIKSEIVSYKTRPIDRRKKWAIPRSTKKRREMS